MIREMDFSSFILIPGSFLTELLGHPDKVSWCKGMQQLHFKGPCASVAFVAPVGCSGG